MVLNANETALRLAGTFEDGAKSQEVNIGQMILNLDINDTIPQ